MADPADDQRTLSADAVIQEFGAALARVAASYERNRALREELLQEIFLAIVTALPRLRDRGKLKPFVFRIAHNRAVRHIVKRVSEQATSRTLDNEVAAAVAADAPSHDQSIIAREQSEALLEAIRSLSLPYRQVMTLLLEDLSYPEIAEVLGLTAINVGVRVNRAKQLLKEHLDHGR
jgi:RNA polymerase sigma-70 factor (ECF subfamily)